MEHIIYHHIMTHPEDHNILADNQHGFRKHRSCETQLVNTVESIARSLDHREQVDMLVLDFSKAFDTVPHQRLLLKMSHYGIRGKVLDWIKAWLTNQKQRVCLDVDMSNMLHHISKATSKANKTLGFIRRNLGKCPTDIRDRAYKALVRPHLEYASAVWDPYRIHQIHKIEMIQRRAARFVTNTYSQEPGTVCWLNQHPTVPRMAYP
jgi:hypothetical protein